MKYNKSKMPVFGLGPIYVIICLFLTIIGICLHFKGYLYIGELTTRSKIIFIIIGILLMLIGLYLWIQAVIVEKINKKVKENKLITTGVYSVVRNPVYTAFLFMFTGILLMMGNYLLLILPFIFWILLSVLMKNTEEKWLKSIFGREYETYCSQVNRVIPSLRRKIN